MTILLSDPRVAAIPVADRGESLSVLGDRFGPARAAVRSSLANRLEQAAYGDRYWALITGADHALYGSVKHNRSDR